MKKPESKNPLNMVSDPYAGDSFILAETLCTEERRVWFRRTNEIIGFFMTTELAIREGIAKYEQIISKQLKPDTPMKIESSDGRSIVLPAQTLLKQINQGIDVLCRQVFIMLYGSLETYLFQLIERSYLEIGITENILNLSLDIMMKRNWDSKLCKLRDVFGLNYKAGELNKHFSEFEMNFEGESFKNPLQFLDKLAQIRHRIVHASSILEKGRLIFINAEVFHAYFGYCALLTEFIDDLFFDKPRFLRRINNANVDQSLLFRKFQQTRNCRPGDIHFFGNLFGALILVIIKTSHFY